LLPVAGQRERDNLGARTMPAIAQSSVWLNLKLGLRSDTKEYDIIGISLTAH
jgi:hypothetical protein